MNWIKQKYWQLLNLYAMIILIIFHDRKFRSFSIEESFDVPEYLQYVGVLSCWARVSYEYNEYDCEPAINLLRDIRYWKSPQAKIDMQKMYADYEDITQGEKS